MFVSYILYVHRTLKTVKDIARESECQNSNQSNPRYQLGYAYLIVTSNPVANFSVSESQWAYVLIQLIRGCRSEENKFIFCFIGKRKYPYCLFNFYNKECIEFLKIFHIFTKSSISSFQNWHYFLCTSRIKVVLKNLNI